MVDAFLDAFKEAIARGDGIELRFKLRYGPARIVRNPRTTEPVQVPGHTVPAFKLSRHHDSRVDRGSDVLVTGEPLGAISKL